MVVQHDKDVIKVPAEGGRIRYTPEFLRFLSTVQSWGDLAEK